MAIGYLSPTTYATGLTLIKTQTIGTSVSSITVNNAFDSTYDNYKIITTGGSASTNDYVTLKLGASATGYYDKMIFGGYGSSTVSGAGNNNISAFAYAGSIYTAEGIFVDIDVYNPNTTKYTVVSTKMAATIHSSAGFYNGIHVVNTAYTDFTLTLTSGTITGGTIYVYGYQKV